MGTLKKLFIFSLLVPFAFCAKADTGKREGVLNGYVTDAITKKPLPGVTVSASVPGSNSTKEVLTDADGYFQFSRLPGCQVNITFDKKGYQSYKRPNIIVGEKGTIKLNIEFQPQQGMDPSESDNSEFPILRLLQAS
ncbi:MAG TPA: carboxypeptidase-like regulatory domain-containing protein [Puia sp.]|nr:carboxypeptidase-like regulatory domain-containing protein [Puia sp.]